MSKLQEKPSALKREHQALKKIKWVIFGFLYPDLDPNCILSGYGSRDPIESGSNPDPDPRHCF
jgi:hypothetical protein